MIPAPSAQVVYVPPVLPAAAGTAASGRRPFLDGLRRLAAAWPGWRVPAEVARIRSYDARSQPREWGRCREAGWYHLARARRALDRGDWAVAERQALRALRWDDTRAAYYLALGEARLGGAGPGLPAAAAALEAAFTLEPTNSYVVDRLRLVYLRQGDRGAEARLLRRALAAGAPAEVWQAELAHLLAWADVPRVA